MAFDIIAEIGQAHEGSLGIAHSYIDALSKTGVNAVKFQTHIADAESSELEPFRVKFSYEDERRIDYWRRMEFTPNQWKGLKEHCEEVGLEFISSPFSNAAVDLLEDLGVKRYKIGSGEVSNLLMLKKIAETGKPIMISSGMSSFAELDKTVDFIKPFGNSLSVFQCTTAYPTKAKQWGLNNIASLRQRYQVPVGFSDHSGDIFACIAAASLGATLFEFHVVFDKDMFGPDAKSSLTMDQTSQLVLGLKDVEQALSNPTDKSSSEEFRELKNIFEKSLAVNRDLPAGTKLEFAMLEAKKPSGQGISANQFEQIIGKRLSRDLSAWSFLTEKDIDNE